MAPDEKPLEPVTKGAYPRIASSVELYSLREVDEERYGFAVRELNAGGWKFLLSTSRYALRAVEPDAGFWERPNSPCG